VVLLAVSRNFVICNVPWQGYGDADIYGFLGTVRQMRYTGFVL
jgi:hypothetical protein